MARPKEQGDAIVSLSAKPIGRRVPYLVLVMFAWWSANAGAASAQHGDCEADRYVFSWSLRDDCALTPRGGTSSGVPVTLATQSSGAWRRLQAPGLSLFERDRRAIRALAGDYRVDFEFLETIGYGTAYERPAPYRSWATERVYVVADTGDFIRLQHVMVMYYRTRDDGTGETRVQGPVVMKHWRQDWRYEDQRLFVFRGDREWQHVTLSPGAAAGRWTQAVYQVDDAPRYEASGRWRHDASRSVWESDRTWRPLPRREASVRNDYDVLVGVNRLTVLPTGWVHGQDNEKLVLDDRGRPVKRLAREQGVNRYRRIVGFDFAAGDMYWQRSRAFWSQVRHYWDALETRTGRVTIRKSVGETPRFAPLFDYAQRLADGKSYAPDAARTFIEKTLAPYVQRESDR